jgi:FHA domain-containing protein
MTLVLRAITLNEEPISQPLIGRFDERGGTIGRSDEATLTLPDPERMISRVQAQILHHDNHYWIENVSTVSPILHNGRALSTGMRVVLQTGDEIRIVGYVLESAFEDDPESATLLRGRTVIPRVQPKAVPPPAARAAPEPPPAPPPPSGSYSSAPPPVSAPAAASPVSPTPPPGEGPPPMPAPVPAASPPSPVRPAVASPAPSASPQAAAYSAASASSPAASPSSLASASAPAQPGAALANDALWRAFLQGAGIDLNLPNGPSPELMRSIGEMLRIVVGGMQRLITMRARAKNEMQAEMTMIQARDNNPLKFSPDAALALQMLLQPQARGFLSGPEAFRDALNDLQSHQVGMAAGMRSALEAVLDRLDPTKIEAQPLERKMLDFVGGRNARLWELYVKEYDVLRDEARDGFQRLLGEALRQAYEAQVRNLDPAPSDDTTGTLTR